MSDNKKIIHVKDLVIKADNVHIQPSRPRWDPFFGPRPNRREEAGERAKHQDRSDYSEDKRDSKPFYRF
ncbi:hypothetical protein SAMN05216238_101123 [Lentibacillus persicus]|uniref:Uncharacterized protein n=1 Tax=Lentibacillus persicus TaxID=640948 RepID=A0A1I1RY39_9BACI|nr:hypothetical protein [Lentibacillus persicus]SFD39236.1 hypothetical protein SAMN05216238_101123 [Lentibacillus persicus]